MRVIDHHFINGAFVPSSGDDAISSVNPTTGEIIGRAILGNAADTQDAIDAAKAAFPAWAATSLSDRGAHLQRLHDAVLERKEDLKQIAIREFGAIDAFADFYAQQSADYFSQAKDLLKPENFEERVGKAVVTKVPVGVAGLLTPWNGDALFVCGKAATALAAGCTVVIKPSELSTLQTQVLMEAFEAAALPPGVVNVVNGRGDPVGDTITKSPDVRKISFTGSTGVGKMINRNATETMKRVTLELGGKSPTIILDDADLEKAIPFVLQAGYFNSGQGCVTGTRILVPRSRLEEFKPAFKAAVEALKVGDPAEPDTVIQPMVSKEHWERVQGYIRKGVEDGAEILTGGEGKPQGLEAGNFVKPTVFVGVSNDMRIAQEEIFGPVLSVIAYDGDDEAVEIANDTEFGLYAYVASEDRPRAKGIADRLQAGSVMINEIARDMIEPFGGFKMSGLGRECGVYGMQAFQEMRAVYGINEPADANDSATPAA